MGFLSSLFGGGDKAAKQAAQQAEADEKARQERIRLGTQEIDRVFGGFDDAFYDQRAQDYYNAALPEFNRERARTQSSLAYALAGRGLLNSSVRNQLETSFGTEIERQRRIIGDAGLSQANDLRARVEDARSRIYDQLLQSSDPAQATAAATRVAADLRQPSPVGALGNFFGDWSRIYLSNLAARQENPSVPPLFGGGGGKDSGRIVK